MWINEYNEQETMRHFGKAFMFNFGLRNLYNEECYNIQ